MSYQMIIEFAECFEWILNDLVSELNPIFIDHMNIALRIEKAKI